MILKSPFEKCPCGEWIKEIDSEISYTNHNENLMYIKKECQCGISYHFVYSHKESSKLLSKVGGLAEVAYSEINDNSRNICQECGSNNLSDFLISHRGELLNIRYYCGECSTGFREIWKTECCYVNDKNSKYFIARDL